MSETSESEPTKAQLLVQRDEARQMAARYIKAIGICIDCDGAGCPECAQSGFEAVSPQHPTWLLDMVRK